MMINDKTRLDDMPKKINTTVTKMMESLPDATQERVTEHLREYILDLQDEMQWQQNYQDSQQSLVQAAQLAKQQIANGKSEPMNYENL